MDEKQLDLNAPLLSVRRLSSTSSTSDGVLIGKVTENLRPNRQYSLPLYKSDWELEEVTKPAAVPFLWEQTPGRAKEEIVRLDAFSPRIKMSPLNEGMNGKEESGDDVYSDALETLSPTESCSWNCSESSLNVIDNTDMMSSRAFSTEPQTRDYLMSRFLPAAKAMIVETPQYVSKKQHAEVNEVPEQVKKVYSGELRPLLEQYYRSNTISPYDQYRQDAENGGEIDVPGGNSNTRSPISSAAEIRRLARTSHSGPLIPTLEKHNSNALYRKRPVFQSKEVHEIETAKSNQFYRSSDSFNITDGSSAYSGPRGRISPYRNESPRSPFHDGASFLGVPKEVQNVEDKRFSSNHKRCDISPRHKKGSRTISPIAEKTLYVDSVNKVGTPRALVSSKAEGPLLECRVIEEDKKGCNHINRGTMLKPTSDMPSSDRILNLRGLGDRSESSKVDSNANMDENIRENDRGNFGVGTLQSPLAPPLPKSPSESWLWRTISLQKPFPKKQGQKTSTAGAKWETIVKTSNIHHDHVRYSEELLHIYQHSES